MKTKHHSLQLAVFIMLVILTVNAARAVDFHCATAQDVQNALTTAAANGANNNIYLTNGYYIGNFNYNASSANNLTVLAEPSVANTQITMDGAGLGRDMNLANSGTGNITVEGITFLRDCGNSGIGALRIAAGGSATILIQNCQFLSSTNTSGEGLEFDSGLNATITNCVVTGSIRDSSAGVAVSGVTGTINLLNCVIMANGGSGFSIYDVGAIINITNSTFTGNYGGGVFCQNSGPLTINGSTFMNNGGSGSLGGVYSYNSGPLTITGSTFIGNSSGYNAGAAYCAATATITGNTFTGNVGYNGNAGALACAGGIINGNTFTENSGAQGGAVACGGAATIIGNAFTGNSASNVGGGINFSGTFTSILSGNTFIGNSAANAGGGAYCSPDSSVPMTFIISSNTFEQNVAGTGGGLYINASTVILQDDLLANNSETGASSQGGGVWVDATSVLYMINNTIFGNTAAGGGGGAAFEVTGTVELLNVYNNIIWGNSASGNGADVWLAGTGQQKVFEYNDVNNMYGVWDIAQNLLNVDPQFFNPVGGDFHFPESSPCTNAGTNGVAGQPLTDLDGNNRTNSAGQIDLGCYEFNNTATHPADTNASFTITAGEFAAYAAAWKAGQPWTNAPASAPNPIPVPANYLTRAGYLMTNGGVYTNDGSARPTNWKP